MVPWVEGYEYQVALLSNLTSESVINILGYRQNSSSSVYVTYTAIWTEDFKEFLSSIEYGKDLFIFYKENYKNGTGVYTIKLYANSEKILEESHTTTNTTYSASYNGVTYIITVTYTSGDFIYNIYHDSVSSENLIVTKTISSANSDVVFWESDKGEEILQDNVYDYYTVNLITNSGTTKEVQIANTSGPYTDYDTEDAIYDVAFERLSDNEVRLTGEFPVKSDGFYLTRENENDKWDYSSFTHVKEQSGNSVVFSDVE